MNFEENADKSIKNRIRPPLEESIMNETKFYDVDGDKYLTSLEEDDTSAISHVGELILWRISTYKVKTILHDIEDDVVILTVEKMGPTILGVPVEKVEEYVTELKVRCVFEEEGADITLSTHIGEPVGTESDKREKDTVVVSA